MGVKNLGNPADCQLELSSPLGKCIVMDVCVYLCQRKALLRFHFSFLVNCKSVVMKGDCFFPLLVVSCSGGSLCIDPADPATSIHHFGSLND